MRGVLYFHALVHTLIRTFYICDLRASVYANKFTRIIPLLFMIYAITKLLIPSMWHTMT